MRSKNGSLQRLNALSGGVRPSIAIPGDGQLNFTVTDGNCDSVVLSAVAIAAFTAYHALGNNVGSLANGVDTNLTSG